MCTDNKDGKTLLREALVHVESASIRAWVLDERNAAIWESIAAKGARTGCEPKRLAAYIVCVAIGA